MSIKPGEFHLFDRHLRRFGAFLLAVSTAYFLLCIKVVLPYFNQKGFFRFGKYGFLVSLWHNRSDPFWMLDRLFSLDNLRYLLELGLPTLYAFLLSPLTIVPALPALIANLLSHPKYMRDLGFHYHTSIVPFLYIGTIDGVSKLSFWVVRSAGSSGLFGGGSKIFGRVLPMLFIVAAIGAQISWSRVPLTNPAMLAAAWRELDSNPSIARIRAGVVRIPPNATVSADYSLVPLLTHRKGIYMFPNPFEASAWGINSENPHDPKVVRYVLLRTGTTATKYTEAIESIRTSEEFVKIYQNDEIELYRRRQSGTASVKSPSKSDF